MLKITSTTWGYRLGGTERCKGICIIEGQKPTQDEFLQTLCQHNYGGYVNWTHNENTTNEYTFYATIYVD